MADSWDPSGLYSPTAAAYGGTVGRELRLTELPRLVPKFARAGEEIRREVLAMPAPPKRKLNGCGRTLKRL